MRISSEKIIIIFIYLISIIAVISISVGFIGNNGEEYQTDEELKQLITSIYNDIDKGNYEKLSEITIEGKWVPSRLIGKKKIYEFDGIVPRETFIEQLKKDFGNGGWRIHFNSLEVVEISKIGLEKFNKLYKKESIILEDITISKKIEKINIATIKGYTIGSCSIVDWEKQLPFFWNGEKWMVIVPGVPEDLKVIHREQWLVDIDFDVKKEH